VRGTPVRTPSLYRPLRRVAPRPFGLVVLGACLLCLAGAVAPGRASAAGPVPLIVDTDIYSNADDVGALASAFALQLSGEAKVIAVTVNTRTSRPAVATDSWKCVAAIDSFYGFSQVPIGTDMPNNGGDSDSPYTAQCAQLAPASTPTPKSAVTVMRQALASQPDGSVVITCVGYEENLAALLQSSADSVGPNGAALVAQKVKMLVVMGGTYPSSSNGPENNLAGNPAAAQYVSNNWPTKLVYSGSEIGDVVYTGQTISSTHPANSPVRVAFETYAGPNHSIQSYDATAVYHAVRPTDPVLSETGPGTNAIDSSGNNVFTTGSGNRFYLTLSNAGTLERSIEALLDRLPPPSSNAAPAISGILEQGQVLTESPGSWSDATKITYQWEDCDSSGANCATIAGATSQTYTLTASDVGHTIRVQELASNASASNSAASPATGLVQPLPAPPPPSPSPGDPGVIAPAQPPAPAPVSPSNTGLPVITGHGAVGQRLVASTGGWSGTDPVFYAFQWQRCRPGCTDISGATRNTYAVTAADEGARVRVLVTATDGAGSARAASGEFGPIATALLSSAKLRALLLAASEPRGSGATIQALLKHGGYSFWFNAPSSGRLVISWYHPSRNGGSLLVGRVTVAFLRSGPAKLKLLLSGRGRKLLRGAKSINLTANGGFTPAGQGTTRVSKTFKLTTRGLRPAG
jgi:inosine-uridine nucleoside N-ribohydrolase